MTNEVQADGEDEQSHRTLDSPSVPAGWFTDPSDPRQQRYWDGARWTDQIAPLPLSQPQAAETATDRPIATARTVALISCVGLMIGAWAPWATAAFASESGTHGDGRFTGLFGLVAGLVLYGYSGKSPRWLLVIAVCAGISLVIAIADISNVSNQSSNFFGQEVHVVSVGWGLWLTAISAFCLAISASRYRAEEKKKLDANTAA